MPASKEAELQQQLVELARRYKWREQFGVRPRTPSPSTPPFDAAASDDSSDSEGYETYIPPQARRRFQQSRDSLTADALERFNNIVFHNRLPRDLSVSWSKRLKTTAGITRINEKTRACRIEMSEKVIVNKDRLESTLLHELCHAAAFLIDNEMTPPHGAAFRRWADHAEETTGITVSTCHSYDIHTPHKFDCTNPDCGVTYGRHSKKGFNIDRFVCGKCQSRVQYSGKFDQDGKVE